MQLIDLDNVPAGYQFDEDGVYQPRSIDWLEEHYPALIYWTQSFSPILRIKQFDYAGGYLILELLDKIKIKARPPELYPGKASDNYLALLYGVQSNVFQESLMDVPYTDYGWQKIEARLLLILHDEVLTHENRQGLRAPVQTTRRSVIHHMFSRLKTITGKLRKALQL